MQHSKLFNWKAFSRAISRWGAYTYSVYFLYNVVDTSSLFKIKNVELSYDN